MAAATLLDGPAPGISYTGRFDTGGFSPYGQWGRAAFPTTDTTCTIPLLSGGMTGTPLIFLQYSVVDKTVIASVSGSTLTLTRTDTTSAAAFSYLILYVK